jgi:hypothetical protein
MDSKNFDSMVKSFGKNASRRGVLRGASVAALGAIALGLGRGQVAAAGCSNRNPCPADLDCTAPCGTVVCKRGNAGGGGGNFCACESPCAGTSRPVCSEFQGSYRCRRN